MKGEMSNEIQCNGDCRLISYEGKQTLRIELVQGAEPPFVCDTDF